MNPAQLEQMTFQHLPRPFLRNVLRGVFQAYGFAWGDCRARFSPRQCDNMVGYEVRGKLEDTLRDVASRFPGIVAVEQRAPGSKWNRTELRSGPVLLVENAVETPCAMLNRAEFRRTLAQSNQGSFWDDETRTSTDPLFVVLVHSRSVWIDKGDHQKWGHLPGSAYLAFPARDLDCYLHDISLFDIFPEVVRAATPQEWSNDAQIRYFRRARKLRAI